MNSVLGLRHVVKEFEQAEKTLQVLRGVDLELKAGEVVALVGPSGSGKTTLLQIAGLLDNPTSGEVMIAGHDLSKAGDRERTDARLKHIGFVYQFHHLLPEFSALENIALPQMMQHKKEQDAIQKSQSLLAALGLADRTTHRPAKLSGGEQQRVAIARALANDPALLLADEPTGNLDQHTAEEVFAMLMKLAKERKLAALVATHNLDLARRMDRIVRLEDGMLK
ncbi:MAG: ABC transporter ATP-binding protein [Rickettsiales bacterium]|jgi:lipoprotein-releasing system ATP-binding protein|nr:ABC transporter ATP-binding protein [Rickettsiales bacterium]